MSRFEIQFSSPEEQTYDVENSQRKEFRLFLIGELTKDNGTELIQSMYDINEINEELGTEIPIILIINTPGGDLQVCQMVCDVMNEIKTPVYTKCLGQACSAGIIILMNGEPGFRTASKHSQMMSHRFSTAIEGSHSDLEYHNKEMQRMYSRLIDHYVFCTGLTKKKIEERLLAEHDTYLTSQECVELNIIDEVIKGKEKNVKRRTKSTRSSKK